MKKASYLIFLFTLSVIVNSQVVRINEFMAVNQSTLADEDGEYSDWIEIFNDTDQSVDLDGWSLSDDVLAPQKWVLPAISLNSKKGLIVFASGKDRSTIGQEFHANFKLDGSGEYLALYDNQGQVVSSFNPIYPQQYTDYSYAFYEGVYIVNTTPSPGQTNEGQVVAKVPEPVFSKKHGFYESTFQLSLTCELPVAKIYYTLDGSEPSLSNGKLYSSAITIDKTSIIRAIALDGDSKSISVTQTYLFLDQVIAQNNSPAGYPDNWGPYTAISGNIIADYEMDPEMLADETFAETVKNALLDMPTLSLVSNKGNFFNLEENEETGGIYAYTGAPLGQTTYGPGRGWERPVSMEYFDAEGNHSVQVNCGIRLQGGHSRRHEKNPKHSFLLVFKDEYGPTRLEYPMFDTESNDKHNKLILRAGFGNSWTHHGHNEREMGTYQRDIWGKDTQREMGHPSSNSSKVHLYINGIYWGMYAPTERMDNDFGAAYLGGDPEDYDVIKDYAEVSDGYIDAWDEMMAQANAGLSTNKAYQKIQGKNAEGVRVKDYEPLCDVVNLADYMMLNFYGSNTDWDHHNWAAMRNRKNPGKGYKFFSWDGEHLIKTVDGNVLGEDNRDCPSHVFQELMRNDYYKRLFADRVQLHCFNGGALTPEAAVERWTERSAIIEEAVNAEAARWGDYRRDVHPYQTVGPFDLYDKENYWLPQQDFMINTYFPQRTDVFLQQLQNNGWFPNVNGPEVKLNNLTTSGGLIKKGDVLSMTINDGLVYYTTDGSDPVIWEKTEAEEFVLCAENADKKVLVPQSDIGSDWATNINYSDASWTDCTGSAGGVGYENGTGLQNYISLDVADQMTSGSNPNTSCYVRIPFTLTAATISKLKTLELNIRFDDGFVAYLNGTQIASGNVNLPLSWNSNNQGNHEGDVVETYNISAFISLLKEGDNLLAIQGVNNSTTSSDFIILPSIIGSDATGGGNVSPDANFYNSEITLNKSTHIKARAFSNGEWSAMIDNYFVLPSDFYDLKITEVNYHPYTVDTNDADEFEFLEIKNTGDADIDLKDLYFDNGIDYKFTEHVQVPPNGFVVLAENQDLFNERYGFYPYDQYRGNLNNNGERLILKDGLDSILVSFKYNDGVVWPQSPDGDGNSLVPTEISPTSNQDSSIYWRASYEKGGSPGADDIKGVLYIDPSDTIPPFVPVIPISGDDLLTTSQGITVSLDQNYPNPFSETTYMNYNLSKPGNIELAIYDLVGKKVIVLENGNKSEGNHLVEWDLGRTGHLGLRSGIYFCQLKANVNGEIKTVTQKIIKQ